MLTKQFIQDYFNADFRDMDSLLYDVLVPIFGDVEKGYDEITHTETAMKMAHSVNIKTIKHVATLFAMGLDIKVFDVTLENSCRIHRARKGIQSLIRQYVDKFEGAFIIFHYEDPKNRSWRFSYLEKRESNVASTNAKRYTYLCGKQYPCRTLAERFEKLQEQELTGVNLEAAFSVETLSDEFFNEYRYFYQDLVNYVKNEGNLIDGFVEYADGDKELAEKYARDYIKKLMGRLVFIQFLQNKAWLNNDIHYTHTLFNNCSEKQKENFLDNVLEPLFFGVFNTPKNEREAYFRSQRWDMKLYEQWKDFPYLNGGLFECDELDQLSLPLPDYFFSNPEKKDHVRTPNDEYYSDACGIFDFFDRYNFTIDESDPLDREVGVDPEMLGKIFENLLEDNKDKGAFYTPKEIVQYMCKEALVSYLVDEARRKSEVNKQRQENFEEAIRAFVTDPEMTVTRMQRYGDQQLKDLDESLRSVKICDPAIGSGAFPMGLLNLLMSCRVALNNALRKGQPRAWLKKEIIQNNIYGVDIEKGAIDIARLRFWLSIVVDLDEPEALPNFDYKFMQGNSLLEQYNGVDLSQVADVQEKNNVGGYQISMFESELDVCRKNLHDKLNEYFTVTNHIKKQSLREEISELVQKELELQHINVDLSGLDITANDQFFLWHTWFANVYNRPHKEGFDIVIGNPPWGADLSRGSKLILKNTYPEIDSSTPNSYAYFIGWGMRNNLSSLVYVLPDSILVKDFKKTRELLSPRTREVKWYQNCGVPRERRLFKDVEHDICIISVDKGSSSQVHLQTNNFEKGNYLSYDVDVAKQFVFRREFDYVYNLKASMQDWGVASKLLKFDALEKIAQCHEGIHSGNVRDKLFIKGYYPGLKPMFYGGRAGDIIRPYVSYMNGWFVDYRESIIDAAAGEYASLRDERLFTLPKIYVTRTGNPFKAFYDENSYASNNFFSLQIKDYNKNTRESLLFLLPFVNSKVCQYFIRTFAAPRLGDSFVETKIIHLLKFPIPEANQEQRLKIVNIVDTILAKKKADPAADTSAEERAIDKLVYSLYALTEDEIKLIEGA